MNGSARAQQRRGKHDSNTRAPPRVLRVGRDLLSPDKGRISRNDETSKKLETLSLERDFYFNKLRDLEVFLDHVCETSGGGDHTAVAAHEIRAILYASNDAFAQP